MAKQLIYPGDGTEHELEVSHFAKYPRGTDGTCVFCSGDPCAEFADDTRIAEFFRRNPRAATCPVCDGRPT